MLQYKNLFQQTFANYKVASFIGSLDKFFIKLPHLPKKIRLLINKIVPVLSLILGSLGLILSFLAGFFLVITLITWDFKAILVNLMSFLLILLNTLFYLKAFKPLKNNNAIGWIYLFWAQILEILNLIVRVFNQEDYILLSLFIILFNFYLLFEIGQFYVYKTKEKNLDKTE